MIKLWEKVLKYIFSSRLLFIPFRGSVVGWEKKKKLYEVIIYVVWNAVDLYI